MLIKNARIYGEESLDLRIENEHIVEISKNISSHSSQIFDAKNLTLLPSFVDLNVNLKNDSFSLENLRLLQSECLQGGLSAILLRDKMNYDENSFDLLKQVLDSLNLDVFASACVLDDECKLKNVSSLVNNGVKALELKSSQNAYAIKQAMNYALMKNVPLFVSCYDENFDDNGVMNDGELSFSLGLSGISAICELSEVAKMKEIAKFYGINIVFESLSLAKSLELLEKEDLKLVSIHNLIKDESACENFNTYAKLLPPLRTKDDVRFLRQALKEGKISFLSSFHSPKSLHLKDLAFYEAAFGVHSISEYVALCNTFFIKENLLSWRELCTYTSLNAAKLLGLNCGEIAINKEANFILLDENEKIATKANSLYSKDELFGNIKAHYVKGSPVN